MTGGSHLDVALWGVLPYLVLVLFVAGGLWRYRYDRFGFTTRSSQLHEHRLLRVAAPAFHYGVLFVAAGHVFGLLVPASVTEAVGVDESLYHAGALLAGGAAGGATVVGLALLVWRRLRVPAVRAATSRGDLVLYPVLVTTLLAGMWATVSSVPEGSYDYREGVSVWFRGLFALDPDTALMGDAPLAYQAHTLLGMALFALWPFSRLVHAFTAPLGYLTRPYVVYRARAAGPGRRHPQAARGESRGWRAER